MATTASESGFPVRDVRFELEEAVRGDWYRGRAGVSSFFNALSVLFPRGERFFIKSVKRYLPQVEDRQLLRDARAFAQQEGVHGREHERYNRGLRERGYDIDRMEREIAFLLGLIQWAGPHADRAALATTVALEHWTALFAHFVLEDDSIMDPAEPVMADLWRFHAAEECEHKSVAYDVYEISGGGYGMRVTMMLVATPLFWIQLARQQHAMLRHDGRGLDPRPWIDTLHFLVVEQRAIGRLAPLWLRYFVPGFHPRQIDDGHLLLRWTETHAPGLTPRAA